MVSQGTFPPGTTDFRNAHQPNRHSQHKIKWGLGICLVNWINETNWMTQLSEQKKILNLNYSTLSPKINELKLGHNVTSDFLSRP